jgi:hypothetical protein
VASESESENLPAIPSSARDGDVGPLSVSIESRRAAATKRIIVWFLFGAIFGLFPIFAAGIREAFSTSGFDMDVVLQHGDVFVVSAVLSAGAFGELIAGASRGVNFYLAVIAGFSCLVAFAGNVLFYTYAAGGSPREIATISFWSFPVTLLTSGLGIWVAAF